MLASLWPLQMRREPLVVGDAAAGAWVDTPWRKPSLAPLTFQNAWKREFGGCSSPTGESSWWHEQGPGQAPQRLWPHFLESPTAVPTSPAAPVFTAFSRRSSAPDCRTQGQVSQGCCPLLLRSDKEPLRRLRGLAAGLRDAKSDGASRFGCVHVARTREGAPSQSKQTFRCCPSRFSAKSRVGKTAMKTSVILHSSCLGS